MNQISNLTTALVSYVHNMNSYRFQYLTLVLHTPEDDPIKGSKHVAFTNYANKSNIDTIVSNLFYCC
jgi:hypothetical protein